MDADDPAPARLVSDLVRGAWRTLAARAMAELRLADALVEPATAEQLAGRLGVHAPTLERLLRTEAALGLVSHRDGRYTLTPAGERLRSYVPGSDWGAMMMMPGPWTLATWAHLPEAVRTGEPVFERVHGEPFWDYLDSHEEERRIFDAAMARQSKDHDAVALVLDVLGEDATGTVVDVAGGTGRLLAQVVAARPALHGMLADLEGPIAGSADVFERYAVADRCEAVVCDFFTGVPEGGSAYLLSNILHDWDDEGCGRILRNIRTAAGPGARVLVLEAVLPDEREGVGPDSAAVHLLDLMMLLNFGARERDLAQYTVLLEEAGFGDVRLVPGAAGSDVVVATVR